MHTVIILSKHSSDLLREYRYLFQPFVDKGAISFCDWNESGTDLETSVPDLYKQIRGGVFFNPLYLYEGTVYLCRGHKAQGCGVSTSAEASDA